MDTRLLDDPLHEPMPPWRLYVALDGRISRRQFWLRGVLVLLGLSILGHMLLAIARVGPHTADAIVGALLTWPAIAVSVKRWHDRDRSGWWVLLYLLPVIGQLWALADNGFVRGTKGSNRFGPDPLDDGHLSLIQQP